MILECPSCSTRYMVQIGLFAQGGRRVRCARCKNEWHASLPTTVDVFAPLPEDTLIPEPQPKPQYTPQPQPFSSSPSSSMPDIPDFMSNPSANLPAVIKKERFSKRTRFLMGGGIAAAALLVMLISLFGSMVSSLGAKAPPDWEGLVFDDVKSELKYDSGTMKLFVDGAIRNETEEKKQIPDIRARALGPDKRIVQNWHVDAPAATIEPGAKIPFHTEVASPMEHTIEDVNLEFVPRKEKANAK